MLKLKIENYPRLPDGGPLTYQVDRRGFDIGRDQHLDWTLPDPSRHISGKHCEIRYLDGAYWLYDVSTNGTFVNKSTRRVQSPYKLADGDELSIGDYIISVAVSGVAAAAAKKPAPLAQDRSPDPESLWGATGEAPAPIDPHELLPQAQRHSRAADFLSSVANIPPAAPRFPEPGAAARPSPRAPPARDPWSTGIGAQVLAGFKSEPFLPAEPNAGWPADPNASLPSSNAAGASSPAPATGPLRQEMQHEPHLSPRGSGPQREQVEREFIRQFAASANIPEHLLSRWEAGELARELGLLMNVVCANLLQLLTARAAAKTLARSGHRTLIKPTENNPLKFMPSAEEALKVMLGPGSESYLTARATLEQSFDDIKAHQLGTLSAMQLAVAELLEELSPEAIEQSTGGKRSLLGTNKSRLWDNFVERWKAKSGRHEHGMLGEFLDLFAEFYDKETPPKR